MVHSIFLPVRRYTEGPSFLPARGGRPYAPRGGRGKGETDPAAYLYEEGAQSSHRGPRIRGFAGAAAQSHVYALGKGGRGARQCALA